MIPQSSSGGLCSGSARFGSFRFALARMFFILFSQLNPGLEGAGVGTLLCIWHILSRRRFRRCRRR